MKKNFLIALSCVGVFAVSCSKDDNDGGSSGPNVSRPGLDLVDVGDFKNTAKSGADVSAKFNQASTSTKAVSFGSTRIRNATDTKSNILSLSSVQSFLSGSDFDGESETLKDEIPTANDCLSQLKTLDSVYKGAADGLKETANLLQKMDGELPDGIVRGAANDQYAVTYTIDLGKVTQEQTSSPNRRSGSIQTPPSTNAKISGLAMIGAGANSTTAVLSVGIDATATGDDGSGSFKGGFAAAAHTDQKLLKFSTNANINAVGKDDSGKPETKRAAGTAKLVLQAGENPSVDLSVTGTSNVTAENGSVGLADHDQSVAASIKVQKLANNDVGVSYSITADAEEKKGELTLTTDLKTGTCTVKNSTAPIAAAAL